MLEKDEVYTIVNEAPHRFLIIENLGPETCYVRSNKSALDFMGYKIMRYGEKEFAVAPDECLEVRCIGKTLVKITGTDI